MPTPRRTVASSSTSTPVTHHISADELAIAEAQDLLSEDEDAGPSELLSPRARRHAALTRARDASADPSSTPTRATMSGVLATAAAATGTPSASTSGAGARSARAGGEGEASAGSVGEGSGSESSASESDSDDSDSEDDSDDSDSDSDSDSDDEDELERMLAAAKVTAAKSAKGAKPKSGSATTTHGHTALGEDADGEFKFETEDAKDAPIPDLSVPQLPPQVLSFAEDGTARSGSGEAGPSKLRGADIAPELDRGAYQRTLSKREKLSQPKKATASELWATIPSARADDLAQMKRDYQALALANTLDPKRFMKGGNRAGKVPEHFAIGTMVDAPRHLQDTTVRKERKYRAGEIVSGLIQDGEVGTYAKRKFEDLQDKRMANGRGKGWKKRSKW